ncbi:MAG: TetR/AcrR family transcriptional regulator [Caulobacteraceae bacterium]|nr:TetR/AcrR family transcriptional regulator [Caulobacteraceae bacterium]
MSDAVLKDKRDQRREAILDVARAVFGEEGYQAASMSTIASRLGGSKGTLYNYFKNKEELFAAHVREECGRFGDGIFDAREGQDLAANLTAIGRRFLGHLLSEWAVRTYQLVVAEAHRTPELAQVFYASGPAVGFARMAAVLEEARARGEIETNDCERAAQQFMALCRGNLHFRYSLNLIGRPSDAEINETIDEAVLTFMARYGRPGAGAGPDRV